MLLASLILAASPALQASPAPSSRFFTPADHEVLSKRAKRECGYASPQEIEPLALAEREKILNCFVAAAVKDGPSLMPRTIETGATIVSVGQFRTFLTMNVQLAPDHPRAVAVEGTSVPFDDTLANLTCRDRWLGGMLDAGMDGNTQAGTIIVYYLRDLKGAIIRISAIGQCHGKRAE